MNNLAKSMHDQMFSTKDPQLARWQGDDPLIIQGSIKDITINRVYVDTSSLVDKGIVFASIQIGGKGGSSSAQDN